MTEEQAADEQSKNASAEEEESTFGRMKSRVKDLVGSDSDDKKRDSEAQDSGEETSEQDDSSSTEAQGSDEESASGEEEGSEEEEGSSVGTDEVELSTVAEDEDTARAQIDKMEEDGPPENLADWPTGKAMYLSFGGAEGEEGYEEGPARQMGPSSLRHHADGGVEVQGEMVDNPDDYKADKSVGDEAEEIGMDKGAKSEGDDGDDSSNEEGSSEEGSSSEEDSSNEGDPQAESSDNANAEADAGDSQSDGSDGDQSEDQQQEDEGQPAEAR